MTKLVIRGAEQIQLTRLWDALLWLDTYDPETTSAMENKFGFNLANRTVYAYNPQEGNDAVSQATKVD